MIKAKEFLRRGAGNDAAGFQQNDAGSKQQGFPQIVSDENDGFAEAAGECTKFTLKLSAGDGIEGAKWFIHQQDRGIRGKGAGHTDTLTLPSRELPRAALCEFARIEAHELEHFLNSRGGASRIPFFQSRNEGDILCHSEMGEETGVLDDVADAAAEADGVPIGGGATLHEDLPL